MVHIVPSWLSETVVRNSFPLGSPLTVVNTIGSLNLFDKIQISLFQSITTRTAGFASIPQDIDESAQIDGASHFRTLFSIYVPASVPSIITVGLFYAIDRWNGYFWAELVLGSKKLFPLQVIVKKLLENTESGQLFQGSVSAFALIIIAIVPIMIIFPFIQKYFKKGVMVGAVK